MLIMKRVFVLLLLLFLLSAPRAYAEEEYISFNFENVQIRTIINQVAELTGKNFVFDEGIITGAVTLKSPTPVAVSEVYGILESILEVKNFALIHSPNLIRIVPRELAGTRGGGVAVGRDPALLPTDERIFTQVIPIMHADSEDIVRTVESYISRTGNIRASARTNTIIITDSASNIGRLMQIIKALDTESPATERRLFVYRLENADAELVAQVLQDINLQQISPQAQFQELPDGRRIRRPAAAAAAEEQKIQIVADPSTNALVITAYLREYEAIKGVIETLDRRRQQVLIEALIAEVTLDKMLEMGTELSTWDDPSPDSSTFFGATDYGMRDSLRRGELSGAVVGVMKGSQIGAILQYYKRDADFTILSSPYVFTRDNEEAQIFIGEDIPFVRESRITERDFADPTVIQTFDYRDVGIHLRITPHISPRGYVRLKVYQLVEKTRDGPTPGTPITVKREIENTVEVLDGHTVVIGGLVRDDTERVVSKIPFLGDIPVLGFFFRASRDISQKTSLLIFITPHVINSPEDMTDLTARKRGEGERLHEGIPAEELFQ